MFTEYGIRNTEYRIQNTEYRIRNIAPVKYHANRLPELSNAIYTQSESRFLALLLLAGMTFSSPVFSS